MSHQGKVPPHNLEAEISVLGGILLDNESINKALESLTPDAFYREAHRSIFNSIIALYQRNEPADILTVANELKKESRLDAIGGASYLSSLVDQVPTAAHVGQYAKIIREKYILRELINGATDIVSKGYQEGADVDEFVDQAESIIFEIASNKTKQSFYPVKDIVKSSFKTIEELYEKKQMITGQATGYTDLDRMTSGLQPSDMVVIAGRPSMGKTAFALCIAEYAACEDKTPCAIFSLEMSKESLVTRLLCSKGEVDASKLRGGFLAESDWPKLTRAAGALSEAPLYIDDSAELTVLEMRAKARRLQREHGLGLVIVDYMQLMRPSGRSDSREREIAEISRSLKALAKELSVPVIALSQLNRGLENRQDKRPQLSDLRESGSLEQDADVVMFIYRDEVYNSESPDAGKAEIIIGKQRNGPIGRVKLAFRGAYTRFDNLAQGMDDLVSPPPADSAMQDFGNDYL